MANCMAKVAEALGVELGEVFRIEDWDLELHDYFKITEKGFINLLVMTLTSGNLHRILCSC